MADISVLNVGGSAKNIKDTSARNSANAVTTAEEYDRQHNINAYAGRSLASVFANEIGSTDIYTWLRNRARNANFAGLRIGDYIDVPVSEGANVPAQTVRYRIGAIDQYYQCGDTAKGHHIVMVPKAPVTVKGDKASNTSYLQWRETNDNNGTAEEKHPYLWLEAPRLGDQRFLARAAVHASERHSRAACASRRALFVFGKAHRSERLELGGLGQDLVALRDGGLRVPGLGKQGLLCRL